MFTPIRPAEKVIAIGYGEIARRCWVIGIDGDRCQLVGNKDVAIVTAGGRLDSFAVLKCCDLYKDTDGVVEGTCPNLADLVRWRAE